LIPVKYFTPFSCGYQLPAALFVDKYYNWRFSMSDYVNNIFKRANLQQIRSFLLSGAEITDIDVLSYHKRLDDGCEGIVALLESLNLPQEQHNKAFNGLASALGAYEEVYTEIGMKVGARIVRQLMTD
jgi:hypothetical protein